MSRTPLARLTLEGRYVRLAPLEREHLDALCAVGLEPELWRFTATHIASRDDMARYVAAALDEYERGVSLPFVTIERASARVVGSTRFGNIELAHRKVEIGWTWITAAYQRTPVNTEAKLLMLRYAFEHLGCHRVELKTNALNQKSRAAIARLGAKEEGTLRKHMINENGTVRDTVYYSILDDEWPVARANLEAKLARHP